MTTVQLTPHPDTPASPVRSLEAQVRTLGPAALSVQFILTGELGRLRISTAGPAERTEGLWRHGLARARNARHHHQLVERDVEIEIL